MEKINFKNSKGLNLVGILHTPKEKTRSAIVIAHGFTSGKDRPRMIKLAELLTNEGFAAFRFDFGGHGESDDRIISTKEQVDDYNSAIDFMRIKGYSKIGLIGSSYGGLCSVLAYSKKVSTMVLWAPNTNKYSSPLYTDEAKKQIKEHGFVNFEKPDKKFKIGKEYFLTGKNINQKELLSNVKVPILIMHGDKDELVPLLDSKNAIKYLPDGSKLIIVKDAGHSFEKYVEILSSNAVLWFKKYLKV